jgi:hypothetical protein
MKKLNVILNGTHITNLEVRTGKTGKDYGK